MQMLMMAIGGLVLIVLVVRGAVAFHEDYSKKNEVKPSEPEKKDAP